jgi:hypothetical protein
MADDSHAFLNIVRTERETQEIYPNSITMSCSGCGHHVTREMPEYSRPPPGTGCAPTYHERSWRERAGMDPVSIYDGNCSGATWGKQDYWTRHNAETHSGPNPLRHLDHNADISEAWTAAQPDYQDRRLIMD